MLEDTCLNQDCYSNNDESEAVTKLALKQDTVLQRDENEIIEQLIVFVYNKENQQLKSLHGIRKQMWSALWTRSIVWLRKLIFEILLN